MNIKISVRNLIFVLIFTFPVSLLAQTKAINLNSRRGNEKHDQIAKDGMKSTTEANSDSAWIHYDDEVNADAWGFLISGEEYDVVAKWDPDSLTNYNGWAITKIKFYVVNANPLIDVKVWEGPNTVEIYSQEVPTFNVNSWTVVTLDTPVSFDASQELWVGYHVDMTGTELGGFVTATDAGPPVDEYGNLYRWNGTWYSDFNNHNLQVMIIPTLNADFEADATDICAGETVNFTNLSTAEDSYDWTFEGGTPSSSTEENPSVQYNTPGTYDVMLEVGLGDDSDTELKTDYIHVYELPAQAGTPVGDSDVCTDQNYSYSIDPVEYAQDYEWELSPEDAGSLITNENEASLLVSDDWIGDFTLRVRATNVCGEGDWSDELEGTVHQSPDIYNLEGGGGYCLDGDGAEITLDGSQSDASYELYLDGEATGNIVEGTGSEISFGQVTDEGYYECKATNDNCEVFMSDQVQVEILFPPIEPGTPEGLDVICNEATTDYTSSGSDDADSYEWILSPEEAGTISSDGLEATVTWDSEFAGIASISLYGINDCGEGNPSNILEVSVGSPQPEIEGEQMVCDWSQETYAVEEHDGSNYTWEIMGGTISEGQGSSTIIVAWQGEGNGTITVEEETIDGCQGSSEEFEVVVDDCTNVPENIDAHTILIYPNPAGDMLNFEVNTKQTLKGEVMIFDQIGHILLKQKMTGNNKIVINLKSLKSGPYIISLKTENGQVINKPFFKK